MSTSLALLSAPKITKLGKSIAGFAIPARSTCPGRTPSCEELCYALSGHFSRGNVRRKHADNYRVSRTAAFVPRMLAEIQRNPDMIIRIHVAGDFYDKLYIQRWLKIVRSCPDTTFYAYTRSWRVPELLPLLVTLGREPNMRLWFSTDRDTGTAPRYKGIPQAYLLVPGEVPPPLPKSCKLVFREARREVMKQVGLAIVCPVENGIPRKQPMTCTKCKLCWQEKL